MRNSSVCLLVAFAATLFTSAQDDSRVITDNGIKFYYNKQQGITPSYIAYFGKLFSHQDLRTLRGDTLYKKSLNTKVVVYNFWFTRCQPCIAEMPALNKLVDLFPSDSVVFVAISFDDSSTLRKFLEKSTFRFQQVSLPQSLIWTMKKLSYYPITFIINRQQEIHYVLFGRVGGQNPAAELTSLLESKIREALKY